MTKQPLTFKMITKNADMLTPVGIFKRLIGEKKFLLESSFQHDTKGNYSFIGANPYAEITGVDNKTTFTDCKNNTTTQYDMNVLDYFKMHFPKENNDLQLQFKGDAIGYTAYDAIRAYEDIGDELTDNIHTTDHHHNLYQTIITYEHRTETYYIITNNINDEKEDEMKKLLQTISKQLDEQIPSPDPDINSVYFKALLTKSSFME